MAAPLESLHMEHTKLHRDSGILDILIIGSILSGSPKPTSGTQIAQLT